MNETSSYRLEPETRTVLPLSRVTRQSIISSTLRADEIQCSVLKYYSLKSPVTCNLFRRSVHDTYVVYAGDRKFALKLYSATLTNSEVILSQLGALRDLSAKGVSVSVPVARADGALTTRIEAPEGTRLAVMFEWAKGKLPKLTETKHAQQFGEALAELHNAGDTIPRSESWPALDIDHIFKTPVKRLESALREIPRGPERLAALAARMSLHLARAQTEGLDRGLCHGDVSLSNACVDDTDFILLDFDNYGLGWRLYDLASYKLEASLLGIEELAWKPFLDAYVRTRPVIQASLNHIGLFMVLRYIWTVSEIVSLSASRGVESVPEFLEDLLPRCEKIEQQVIGQ